MEHSWQYPLFLIRHGEGYASIVDSAAPSDANQALAVFRREESALEFMNQCGILGTLRSLRNDREFIWLLRSVQAPVAHVVLDPEAQLSSEGGEPWQASVEELLASHLIADNSPWSYPVFVVAQGEGFVSIQGQGGDGNTLHAVAFFESEAKVSKYLEAADEEGTAVPLKDMEQARSFLVSVNAEVSAVAWNPAVLEGQRVAKHCFAVDTLLQKYLIASEDSDDSA